MGVAVVGVEFGVCFSAANAGVAIGPRAVAADKNIAIILLGASNVFSFSNIFFLRPRVSSIGQGPALLRKAAIPSLIPGRLDYTGRIFLSDCENVNWGLREC